MPRHEASPVSEQMKNIIHHLYVVQNVKLEDLRTRMKEQYGFERTSNQYQKLLKDWGYNKTHQRRDWRIVKRKIDTRQKDKKMSNVYINMKLVPTEVVKKECSRQGFMTALENVQFNRESTPATPSGFSIHTPGPYLVVHFALCNLPILNFANSGRNLPESVTKSEVGASIFLPHPNSNVTKMIESILPTSAFVDEETAAGLGLDRIERLGPTEFLNLTTYMISNNFPGDSNGEEIYAWLKARGSANVLNYLASVDGTATRALLEAIFRLAVGAGDTVVVQELLKLKVDPNGHRISHGGIAEMLDPLKYACVTGNTNMAQALIEGGSIVEESESGWERSIIVLAIIGENKALHGFYLEAFGVTKFQKTKYGDLSKWNMSQNVLPPVQEARFLELIGSLITAGARVNIEDDYSRCRVSSDKEAGSLEMNEESSKATGWHRYELRAFRGCDSPLVAAAKYRHQNVVELLLKLGADVSLRGPLNTSPLQESIFSCEEMEYCVQHFREFGPPNLKKWNERRENLSVYRESCMVGIARILLKAGANPNETVTDQPRFPDCKGKYCRITKHHHQSSILDLAAMKGSMELVEDLLACGARPTKLCLVNAMKSGSLSIFKRLLDADAPVSQRTIELAANTPGYDFFGLILAKRKDSSSRICSIIEAIRNGIIDERLELDSFDFTSLAECTGALQEAIRECYAKNKTNLLRLLLNSYPTSRIVLFPALNHKPSSAFSDVQTWTDERIRYCLFPRNTDTHLDSDYDMLLSSVIKKQPSVAIELIRRGVPLNPKCTVRGSPEKSGDILVAAILAGDNGIITELLEAGADTNAQGDLFFDYETQAYKGITPLTAAIRILNRAGDDVALIKNLLERKADPYDENAFLEAFNRDDVFQLLLDWALRKAQQFPDTSTMIWHTAFEYSVIREDLSLARMLLVNGRLLDPNFVWKDVRPLYIALKHDLGPECEFFSLLLEYGADLNLEWHYSALLLAVESRNPQFIRVLLQRDRAGLPCSLEAKSIALQFAIDTFRKEDNMQLLLEHGADPNVVSFRGTPLQLVTEQRQVTEEKQHETVLKLLQHGAQPNILGFCASNSPLQNAVTSSYNSVVQLLLEYGADPNYVHNKSANATYVGHPGHRECGFDDGISSAFTCLQTAATKTNIASVRLLLEHKADPDLMPNIPSNTPLQICVEKGDKETTELLLAYGANVNAPPCPNSGATALQFAAVKGYLGIAFLLLSYGANVNASGATVDGRTALEAAAEYGRTDMIKLLLNAGVDVHGDGRAQYERALNFASANGHHAARQLMEEHCGSVKEEDTDVMMTE